MTAVEPRHWIAVASAEHVALGRAQGFMQVCHGRAAPLRRLHAGDWVSYYSPSTRFGGKDRLQAFTALGRVLPGAPYAMTWAAASSRSAAMSPGCRQGRPLSSRCSISWTSLPAGACGAISSASGCSPSARMT